MAMRLTLAGCRAGADVLTLAAQNAVAEALALSARLVAAVETAEKGSGGLLSRPVLHLAGEVRYALAKVGIAVPDVFLDPRARRD
jgi:hypothetical protein